MRRGFRLGVVLGVAVTVSATYARAASEEDIRTASQFFQGLRDKGYYDLATEYLEAVRNQADTPASIKETAEYEFGRLLLDEASKSGDLARRKELLDQARVKLDAFTKGNPNHVKAPEALVELARLLVERGHLAMLLADETEDKTEKAGKLAESRGSLDAARAAYLAAEARLKADFAKFPPYISSDDAAHRAQRDEKERTHNALMQAQLQKAVVDYEQGESYKIGTPERAELMGKALAQFETLYKSYRTQMAGLTARMWQAKCYEERGELGPAMGIYNELMQHDAPQLRPLQRYVGYFRIIVLAKRKEYALAMDEADRWLKANDSNEARRSKEGMGVQLELAKNILAQLPTADEKAKGSMIKQATDVLGQLVRYSSPYKPEAIELLKKYKPKTAALATDVARLNYEDALSAGEQAIASQELDRAIPLLKQAIKRAEMLKDMDKVNLARYNLAFTYYMSKQYYEALVICDHLARRYPRAGLSPKAAEMGMASLASAFEPKFSPIDRTTDVTNLISLCTYIAETYPDQDTGDAAKIMLGNIYHGTGRYELAVKAFDSVRPKGAKAVEAQTLVGGSHWKNSLSLREKGQTAPADAEQAKAIESLKAALKARQDGGNPPTDPALIANACDLSEIYLDTGKPADALALVDPIAKEQKPPYLPIFPRLMSDRLRAHIGTNQVDLAIADMGVLEQAGGTGSGLTQLYFNLGKRLKEEMDALKLKGDSAGLNRTQAAYQKFLTALVASKSGQTFDSLYWAGSNMLALGNAKESQGVFEQILKTYKDDAKFNAAPGAQGRLMVTRLKLATAYRRLGNFTEAATLVDQLAAENPTSIEVLMEKGNLLEDQAIASNKPKDWSTSYRQWQSIANRLSRMKVKPPEYYDAWYHAAFALNKENKPKEAKQTLAGVMRLSPTLGGPEMKAKYKTLLAEIK